MTPASVRAKIPRRNVVNPRPFGQAMTWTSLVWLIGVVLLCLLIGFDVPKVSEIGLRDAFLLALASLLISQVSMVPSLLAPWLPSYSFRSRRKGQDRPKNRGEDTSLVTLLGFGILFRLLGTVALFLTCGYHMPSRTETIAAMTIGWYVLLTFVEVLVLARKLPNSVPSSSDLDSGTRTQWSAKMGTMSDPDRLSLKQNQNVG